MVLFTKGRKDFRLWIWPIRSRSLATAGAGVLGVMLLANGATAQSSGGSYRFDEGSGSTATDSSGAGNNGTIVGASYVTGRPGAGTALRFGASLNNNVTLPFSIFSGFTNTVYVEAWIRPTSFPSTSCIAGVVWKRSPNNDFTVALRSNGGFYMVLGGKAAGVPASAGGYFGAGSVELNTWAKVSAWYDGTTLRGYVNDVEIGSSTKAMTLDWSANRIEIGNDTYDTGINCADYGFHGDMGLSGSLCNWL